jgi:MoaA/NifB/PqqE/SkfB family radical SAM enzyme
MTAHVDPLRARADSVCIEVTNKCNLRCSYCPKSDDLYEALPGNNTDMSDDTIGRLYQYCKTHGIRNVSLSGVGETAMVAGWQKRLAQFLDDPQIDAHLVSNFARILSDAELEALTKLRNLQISFDSPEVDMVRRMRSKADLRTITYNIIRLRQKARELARCPTIDVNCTLSRENIGHVAKLAGFCRELGVDRVMFGEVMVLSQHNEKMPLTLDSLTSEEVILLAEQFVAAEEILKDSDTAIYLQDHLRGRIGEIVEQIREGTIPADAGAFFHRRMESSACRLPWSQPFIRADGKVYPCCIINDVAQPVGDLATAALDEILESPAFRAIRASILAGKPNLSCDGCGLAQAKSFPEFIQDIRAWQGQAIEANYDSDARRAAWPGLLRRADYPVITENSQLTFDDQGAATLIEDKLNGYHRVLIDFERARVSEISFRAKAAGRRRLRLDLADNGEMAGRAHIVLTSHPHIDIAIGSFACVAKPMPGRWYEVRVNFSDPKEMSHINLSLLRDDNAVIYSGDGESGLTLVDFSIQQGSPSVPLRQNPTLVQ